MTKTELDAMAHQIAYNTARSDIEINTRSSPEPTNLGHGTWYDLSTVIIGEYERECVAKAIFYLDARGLLHRNPKAPYMAVIMLEPIGVTTLELEPLEGAAA